MSLLNNIKSNFLGNRNSFNVTFNNKSPLSYVGPESLPPHGSSIQTQMEAPAVKDVYAAHSPKEYLEAETKMHQAKGGAIGKLTSGLIAGVTGKGGSFGDRFKKGYQEGILNLGPEKKSAFEGFAEMLEEKDESPSTDEMKDSWCKDNPDSELCN